MTVSPARQSYDLILIAPTGEQIGLMLYRGEPDKRRPAKVLPRFGPSNEQETIVIRDVPVAMDDFSGGFGYSQRSDQASNTYAWTEGLTCRNPRVVVPAGELTQVVDLGLIGRVTTSLEYNGDLWFGTTGGRLILSDNSGTDTPTVFATIAGGNGLRSSAEYQGNAYFGGGTDLARINSGGSVASLTGIRRDFITTVFTVTADNIGATRLVGSDTDYTIKYTSGDPSVAGNWSNAITMGDTTHPITGIAASNRHAYFLKINGIHDLDELGNTPNLTPYWKQTLDTSAVQVALIQDGYMYATQGRRGLERINLAQGPIRRDAPEWCHPGFGISNETPIQGYVTAMVNEQGWLCAAVFNPVNGKSYIMYGKDRRAIGIDGPGPLLWHGAEAVISPTGTTAEVTNLHLSVPPSGNPVLWISVHQQPSQHLVMYKLDLPRAVSPLGDVFQGGAHRFTTSGTLYTTAQDWGQSYSMLNKHVWGYDVRADNLSAGTRQIVVSSNDYGGAFSTEGTITTSPLQQLGTPSTVPIITEGHAIGLRMVFAAQATSVPILRGVQIRAGVMAQQDEYIPCEMEYGAGVPLRQPADTDRQAVGTVHDALIALQGVTPFTAVLPDGRTKTVRMGQGIEFEQTEGSIYGEFRERARFLLRVMV